MVRGIDRCLVVVDLPFGSYQSNSEIALASAIRIMKETGGHMPSNWKVVKKWWTASERSYRRHSGNGTSGLTPQSIYKFGTYTVRAKEEAEAEKLKKDAMLLQEAGCFAIVLEKIPANWQRSI